MEQSRRSLKNSSVIVLVFTGLSLINTVFELLFGELNDAVISAGVPDNALLVAKIILLLVSVLLLLPRIYIGLKGIKMAKNPDFSKEHIILGSILPVFSVIGLIFLLVEVIKRGVAFESLLEILGAVVDVLVFFDYVKCAKAVASAK